MQFPTGGPLEPTLYHRLFSRYSATKQVYVACPVMFRPWSWQSIAGLKLWKKWSDFDPQRFAQRLGSCLRYKFASKLSENCHRKKDDRQTDRRTDRQTRVILLPCDALRCTVFGITILSVCPSVCPSDTLVDCVHVVRSTIMISSPNGSPIMLVSGDITIIPKSEGGHPERGRWMRVGWVRIGDFRPISRRISETVRDTTKVTINH